MTTLMLASTSTKNIIQATLESCACTRTSEVKAELFTLSTAYPTPPRMTLKTAPSAPRRQASWKALILPPSFLCSRGGIMDWAHCPKGSPHAARK